MKKKIFFILYLLICYNIYSQDFEWALSAGSWVDDYAVCVKADFDNNVFLTGHLNSGTTIGDTTFGERGAYLANFSSDGSVKWVVRFGTFDTYGVDIAFDKEDNVYLTGKYSSGFKIDDIQFPGAYTSRVFVMKFNKNGNLIWAKHFFGSNNTFVNAIEVDSNNDIYIGGNFNNRITLGDSTYITRGRENIDYDMLLLKLSPEGEVLSVKNPGSTREEYIYDLEINSDGVYAVGYLGGRITEFDTLEYDNPNVYQGFIVKYSMLGEIEWVNTLNAPSYSTTFSITTNLNGEIIIASRWVDRNSIEGKKISIAKYSKGGKLLYHQMINHSENQSKFIEGDFRAKRLNLTSNGRFVYLSASIAGNFNTDSLNYKSIGSNDAAVIKLNELGVAQWITTAKGIGNDKGISVSSFGNSIYLAGDYSSGVLNLSDLTLNNNSGNNNNDFFLTKLIDTNSVQCPDINSFSLSYDSSLCEGDSIIVSIDGSYTTYTEWFKDEEKLNFDNEKQIYIAKEGTYKVQINKKTSCPVPEISINVDLEQYLDDNTDIVILSKPMANIEGPKKMCAGQLISLDVTTLNSTYLWQDSSTSPIINVSQFGNYWAKVTRNNCSVIDSVLITEGYCDALLEIPNIFTPNNDGYNDYLVPIISSRITSMNTIIYNRWGSKVFETDNLMIEWDGKNASDGVYFYIIHYTDIIGVKKIIKGYLTVLR